MKTFPLTAIGTAVLLLGGALHTANAASHDYFIHFGGDNGGWVQPGDVTINHQWGNPLLPKPGACGIRLLGSENTQWVTEYGQHQGTANASDPIIVRLRDLPGCSGNGIDISVNGNPVSLPNYGIESFFVYQADNFRWIDNSGNVISPPPCGACQGPGRIKAAQHDGRWNSSVFALQNANASATRDGGRPLPTKSVIASLRAVQPAQALRGLEADLTAAIELRRRESAGLEDRDLRDREDTALVALADAGSSALRCEQAWSRGSSEASQLCESAARLAERARAAIDVAVDLSSD